MNLDFLRVYQKEAIYSLIENNWTGILEMATGTGKTFTSLAASLIYKEEHGSIFRVILVPFIHLMEQWEEECNNLGIKRIIKCSSNNRGWDFELNRAILEYKIGFLNSATVILTYDTAKTDRFKKSIVRLDGKIFLIADECHYMGVKSMDIEIFKNSRALVGLSATPDRWWDEAGTRKIYKLFGKTVYEYDLEKAIENNYLVEYKYNPIVVDLDEFEISEYEYLTRRIIIYLNSKDRNEERLRTLLLARKKIVDNAYSKEEKLIEIFSNKNIELTSDTLIYCTPQNIDDITKQLGGLGYKIRKFNYEVPNVERQRILKDFSDGKIQILTAIKCLDEGVDIPSVKDAYFLSSTSNPREFIQRRGRILRTHENKFMANIYDFIVLPDINESNLFENIVKKELPRFAEFSRYAINSISCRKEVSDILSKFNLQHLMDKLPWEVYLEEKERFEDGN